MSDEGSPGNRMFVYGSLRRGVPNSRYALIGGLARYVGLGRTRGRLYRVSDYPALVPSRGDTAWVLGEVYDFTPAPHLFARLDAYEGCGPSDPLPHQFRREPCEVTLDSGDHVTAWAYVYTKPVHESQLIPSGDYRRSTQRAAQAPAARRPKPGLTSPARPKPQAGRVAPRARVSSVPPRQRERHVHASRQAHPPSAGGDGVHWRPSTSNRRPVSGPQARPSTLRRARTSNRTC